MPFSWTAYRPKLSFLLLHYTYIITIALIGGSVLYGQHNLPFVDALFLASGAATQSGLNTIDIYTMKLYQQILMHIVPLITNPIFINTVIVFVRIHWFEKRLESLVQGAKLGRWKTTTKSRPEPQDVDPEREGRGVAGRPITVVREAPPSSLRDIALVDLKLDENQPPTENSTAIQSRASSKRNSDEITHLVSKVNPPTNGDVHNAVTPREEGDSEAASFNNNSSEGAPTIVNQNNGQNTHIVFADNQRPPEKRTGVLRIPSPREFERGGTVEDIEEDDPNTLRRIQTTGQVSVNEDPGPSHSQGRIRRRMGSITERIIPRPRSQTLEAISSSFSRGRSTSPMSKLSRRTSRPDPVPMPYLSYRPTVGRNSAFVDLTDDQKDELGGLEYRALKLLAKILVGYMIIFQVIGFVGTLPWIMNHDHYGKYVESWGVGRVWWTIFTTNSAFNDVGFTLTPDSMVSFQRAAWPLMLFSFLIIVGNTGFPCLLRFIIWVMKKIVPAGSSPEAPLGYLLDHPRRCFTLLFPAAATWWLFAILMILNCSDLILFIILDLNDSDVMAIPVGYRVLSGWFQAVSTRTAGLSVVNIAALHPAMQVCYMVMMYISIFPIAISVRRTNVYEESALGIYAVEEEVDGKSPSFVGAHLRNQLQYDLWYIFLGLFIISIVEGNRIESKEQYAFTLFAILFEVVSAYGTVGLSLGYPDVNTSFSGQFKTISKLVIIAMQIRGRHRSLPYQVDRAILLPSESLLRDQRLNRRPSFVANGAGLPLGPSLSQATSRSRNMARPMTADDREHRD